MKLFRVILAGMVLLLASTLSAQVYQSDEMSFRLETLLPGLSHPWSLALVEPAGSGPPREGFITIRSGTLLYIRNIPLPGRGGRADFQPVKGLPDIFAAGQGGLLDVILAENYRENSRIYFSASRTDRNRRAGTAVYTARFNEAGMRLDQVQEIFFLQKTSRSTIHFGSRLVLGPDGDLYFSVGERGEPQRAQDRNDAAGSIMRIPLNAVGLPAGEAENYSYGHRNIQGMLYHPDEDRLIAHEHGPKGGDEINLILPGANYGWPRVSYGVNYSGSKVSDYTSLPGIVEPVIYWTPSIAPSGFLLYPERGVFASGRGRGWSGQLFVGALVGRHLRRVSLPTGWQNESRWPLNGQAEEELLLHNAIGRIRDLRVDDSGYIYILTDEINGTLYRLIPADQ